MRLCAYSYCTLLCRVWLISLGGLLFSKWIQMRREGMVVWESLGGVEGEQAVGGVYCLREEQIKRGKE